MLGQIAAIKFGQGVVCAGQMVACVRTVLASRGIDEGRVFGLEVSFMDGKNGVR